MKHTFKIFVILLVLMFSGSVFAETISEIDARADRFYKEKRFSEAIREWLSALDMDPANEKIQQKVEMVYEEKHRKNMALQRSKMQMRETYNTYEPKSADEVEKETNTAVDNFVIAYRIDPNDPEMKTLREKTEKFQRDMYAIILKKRRSLEDRRRYEAAVMIARQEMDEGKYDEAKTDWDKALDIFMDDPVAREGKRKAELAISNRLKYEKIKSLLASGIQLFTLAKYNEALTEFKQVILIDPENDEADSYISKIEDIVDAQQGYERKRQQAEQFYQEGLSDLTANRFNEARDNLENALNLIPNYKDAEARINSIKRLRDEYNEKLKRQRNTEIDREFQSGLIAFSDGRYKDALVSLEKTLLLDPKNALAMSYLEKTKEALKEQQEEEVDESSPYYPIISSLIISGKELYKKEKFSESRAQFEKIRTLFPNNKIAIEFILKCDMKLNPEKFQSFAARIMEEGKEALGKRDFRKALSRFQIIKSITPDYPEIDQLIAKAKKPGAEQKRTTAAGVVVTTEEIERRYQLSISLYKKGGDQNIKTALENLRWIAQYDPENMKAIIALNKIESQQRNENMVEAEQTGPKLTENQKKLIREYLFKGISHYSNNNYEKAIDEWRKVLAIDPTNEKAKNNIRKCLALLKR